MLRTLLLAGLGLYVVAAAGWVLSAGVVRDGGPVELLNVACDPTRELWRDLNARFAERYQLEAGVPVGILQAHGGSGSQARAVIDGLDADVLTLALWTDTDAVRRAGRIAPGWEGKLPNRSLPYTSTIVLVVRAGNPRGVRDWPDLLRPGVQVVTPNPKTSGNGKWSFLALWGSVLARGGTDAEARTFAGEVFRRVPVLDTAARGATMTFMQKGIGDVHLTWENEAHLEVQESGGRLEIVYPPVSVLAEPHVAVVDAVVDRKGTRAVAEAYLRYLYTDEAQEVIARHHYRPTTDAVRRRTADRFPPVGLFPATACGPDWDAIQKRFFSEGGVFDQLLAEGRVVNTASRRALPGFALGLGTTLLYLSLLVLLPLAAGVLKAADLSWREFAAAVWTPRAVAAYRLTFLASLTAAGINVVLGLIVAWTLVRYRFPGRRLVDALVDVPFALPTAVAGLVYASLYVRTGWLGQVLVPLGVEAAYTRLGVVLVLVFTGFPFVVRTVQPVLADLDAELEEAAAVLGAGRWQTFRRVLLPTLLPPALTGFTLAFARAVGEYGSVIFISSNMPYETEIAPVLIVAKLEAFEYREAAAVAVVLLGVSFGLLLVINRLDRWGRKHE